MEYTLQFLFEVTNNKAKYEALLADQKLAKQLGIDHLKVLTNFQLIANQVTGKYEAQDSTMTKYLVKVWALTTTLKYFRIFHIPWS